MFSSTFYGNLETIVFFAALYAAYYVVKKVYFMIQDYRRLCIQRERQKLLFKILLGVYGAMGLISLYTYGRSWWNRIKYRYSPATIINWLNREFRIFPEMDNLANKLETIIKQPVNSKKSPNLCGIPNPPLNMNNLMNVAGAFIKQPIPVNKNKNPIEKKNHKIKKYKKEEEYKNEKENKAVPMNPVVSCNKNIPVIPFNLKK